MNKIDAYGFDKAVFLDRTVLVELEQEFGHAVLCDLVFMAIKSAEHELLLFQSALGSKDMPAMQRLSHSMIGVFGQYGALHASQLASKLYHAQDNQIEQYAKQLVCAGKVAIELLKQYLNPATAMAEFA